MPSVSTAANECSSRTAAVARCRYFESSTCQTPGTHWPVRCGGSGAEMAGTPGASSGGCRRSAERMSNAGHQYPRNASQSTPAPQNGEAISCVLTATAREIRQRENGGKKRVVPGGCRVRIATGPLVPFHLVSSVPLPTISSYPEAITRLPFPSSLFSSSQRTLVSFPRFFVPHKQPKRFSCLSLFLVIPNTHFFFFRSIPSFLTKQPHKNNIHNGRRTEAR